MVRKTGFFCRLFFFLITLLFILPATTHAGPALVSRGAGRDGARANIRGGFYYLEALLRWLGGKELGR